jgi:hypothetical protein
MPLSWRPNRFGRQPLSASGRHGGGGMPRPVSMSMNEPSDPSANVTRHYSPTPIDNDLLNSQNNGRGG